MNTQYILQNDCRWNPEHSLSPSIFPELGGTTVLGVWK